MEGRARSLAVAVLCLTMLCCCGDCGAPKAPAHILRGSSRVKHPRLEGPICPPVEFHEQNRRRIEEEARAAQANETWGASAEDDDGAEVGLPYQEQTPLLRGHTDVAEARDAKSYAAEAARCMGKLDIDGAIACYEEALELEPEAGWLLDAFGSILAEIGRIAEAEKMFEKSMQCDPESSHIKYMYLGQLRPGQEGTDLFRRGIGVLEKEKVEFEEFLQRPELCAAAQEGVLDVNRKLCTARCTLAEALLAQDDTGAADQEAETELLNAKESDPSSPEPLQGLASLRLSQERKDEAVALLQTLYQKLKDSPIETRMSIDFRLQSAKLFIEAGLLHECVRTLKTVQQEKDTVAELWYLYCFVYRLMGKEDKVLEAAKRGKIYLKSVGGFEQARHPVTGELLLPEDFDDVVHSFDTSDRSLHSLVQEDRDEEEKAQRMGMELSRQGLPEESGQDDDEPASDGEGEQGHSGQGSSIEMEDSE